MFWTFHSPWRKEFEILRAVYCEDKLTALSRYALIAGSVGSGTKACLPPEGDWMTSAPWLQATRGIRGRRRTWRAALQRRGGPADAAAGSSAIAQEPYAVSLAGRARAHSRGAPSGPWPPLVDYLKGKD